MNTTVYLIRHSVRLNLANILSYHTNQNNTLLNEKVVLSEIGERRAIFSHGYAITFFLMIWCKFRYDDLNDNLIFSFNGEEIFNGKLNAPDVFKLTFDEHDKVLDIENIKFDDLPYHQTVSEEIV